MDHQSWIEGIDGLASLYAFDILPDGSFSEIRLMAVNKQNEGMLHFSPDAPEFYPGIPYRSYWMDLNFERYLYNSGSTRRSLYSYVYARGFWLKGFYIPVSSLDVPASEGAVKTVYCMYILEYADDIETDSMSQHSADVANAVTNLSIKLHEVQDFNQSMTAAATDIKSICGAENCSIYTVDNSNQKCCFFNTDGIQDELLNGIAADMECSPHELAERWEKVLAMSDCLLLEDLAVIKERDPQWYASLKSRGIHNIILYEIRYKQSLVGFVWAANFNTEKLMQIKKTLELSSFLLGAVIQNHQLINRLEERSSVDGLTQVSNRNAMNDRVDKLVSGEDELPETMGIVFADLNGLKNVNDDEGHDAGDRLLTRAAGLLKIAFGDYEIYRAGGDEFVIFMPDTSEDVIEKQAAQLSALTENTADVRFAVGTSYFTGKYDICQAMQLADERMYKDKEEYYRLNPDKDRRKRHRE